MGRGEGKKTKRNESIEMKIISKVDTELRVQPEEGMGERGKIQNIERTDTRNRNFISGIFYGIDQIR